MKTTKIGVISIKNYMQMTIDIAAGRRKAEKDMPTIWIPDLIGVTREFGLFSTLRNF